MKKIDFKSKKIWAIPVALFALAGVIGVRLSFGAGTATLSLSPASGSHEINSTFTVAVVENSGSQSVSSIEANLTYDPSKLQFVSINNNGSPFSTCFGAQGGGGSVTTGGCTSLGSSATGSQTIANVTFKVLAGSGTTSVNFASNSTLLQPDDTDIWNGNTAGGTYTLTTPATGGGGGGSTGGGGGSTSTGGSGSSGSTSTAPKSGGSTSANPGTSNGGSTSATSQNSDTSQTPAYNLEDNNPFTNNMIAVKVTDEAGKPVAGANVKLGDNEAISDASGIASFINVAAGKYKVTVKTANKEITKEIDVQDQPGGQVQQFAVELKQPFNWLLIIPAVLLLAIIAGVVFLIIKRRQKRIDDHHGLDKLNSGPGDPVAADGASSSATTGVIEPNTNGETAKPAAETPPDTPPAPDEVIKPEKPA